MSCRSCDGRLASCGEEGVQGVEVEDAAEVVDRLEEPDVDGVLLVLAASAALATRSAVVPDGVATQPPCPRTALAKIRKPDRSRSLTVVPGTRDPPGELIAKKCR